MKRNICILVLSCFVAFVAISSVSAEEGKKKIKVPPAVQKTVDEQSKGAVIRGLSKEVENGKTQYELELTVNGHSKDMLIDPNGSILVIEEEVTLDSLAPAVKAEVQKTIGSAKLVRLESMTKGGTLTGFEATVLRAGKKVSVEMAADGKPKPAGKKSR